MRGFRNAFIAGLLLCLPLVVTVYVVQILVDFTGRPLKEHIRSLANSLAEMVGWVKPDNFWVERTEMLVSALIVILFITGIGLLSRYFFGRYMFNLMERLIERVPMIKTVYASVKQIVETFGAKNKANFKQVVLVQFPHPEAWTVAFVTNRDPSELSQALGYPVVHVFVPTTPNPTGGYFLVVRADSVKLLRMSVAEGMRLIVSGGAVLPQPAGDAAKPAAGAPERHSKKKRDREDR